MTILPVDHHVDHKVGPLVFILVENIAVRTCHMEENRLKLKIQNGRQGAFSAHFSL
jgi:hypothetical protein